MSYVIYKICCDEVPEYVYVGSTTNFRVRKAQHKQSCNNEKRYHLKIYKFIRENGGWDAWRMVVIEELGQITKIQAHIKEEEYRVKLNGNLNTVRAYRSEEEKKEENKERTKEFYKNNKELVKENKKTYYKNNKELIKENKKTYYINNKEELQEEHKEYYQNNKEKIIKKVREFYKNNKEELYGQIICECGAKTSKHHLKRHYKSKKHIKFITK